MKIDTELKLNWFIRIIRVLSLIGLLSAILGLIVCLFNVGIKSDLNKIYTTIGLMVFIIGLTCGLANILLYYFLSAISETLSNSYEILAEIKLIRKETKK